MSIFYGDIGDSIAFGIQAIDQPEVANFSASGDEVYIRIFTNNSNIAYTNFANAGLIGTSNYDPTATNMNNLYLGTITRSNVLNKTIVIQENRVGINSQSPITTLDVVGNLRATGGVVTSNITPMSVNGPVTFGYARVLDVESLVVRSNITVTLTGNSTYTNLPTSVVTLDPGTGKILDQYISSNIVRLMTSNGLINPNLLPNIQGYQSSSVTNNYLGVGLDNPQQPLHVNGNACVTGGRLSLGTITPLAVLHVADDNGPNPTVLVEQLGTVDPLQVIGSNSAPLFIIKSYNTVGVGTLSPSPAYAMEVKGGFRADSLRTGSLLQSDTGTLGLNNNNLQGILNLTTSNLFVQSTLSLPGTLTTSNLVSAIQVRAPVVYTDTLTTATQAYITTQTPVDIQGFATSLYTTPSQTFGTTSNATRIGLRVAENVIAQAYLSVSDARAKMDVSPLDPDASLQAVSGIQAYEYNMADPRDDGHQRRLTGFLAQEVESVVPGAVRQIRNAVPSILRYATSSADGTVLCLTQHGLVEGDEVRIITDDVISYNTVIRIAEVISEDFFRVEPPLSQANEGTIFIYGKMVQDFRLLDYERLLPYTFSAIRGIHDRLLALEQQMAAVRNALGI